MSDQPMKRWVVAFSMKDERQFRYAVKDGDAGRELLDAVSRQAQVGKPIAIFFYGMEQELTGAIQVNEIITANTFQEGIE